MLWQAFRHARWAVLFFTFLPAVRLLFGWILPPVLRYMWHNRSMLHLAQDDKPVYHKVECVAAGLKYGSHSREYMDILVPSELPDLGGAGQSYADYAVALLWTLLDLVTCYPRALYRFFFPCSNASHVRAKEFPRAIVFIHGGGMCAVDPAIQHHQLTAFARAGFAVYSIAYPWAPENPFPAQVVSTLKALSWIHRCHGRGSVSLVGESAGGTLVTTVGALLSNPGALAEFDRRCHDFYGAYEDVAHWRYPTIDRVISWYGILDDSSWRGRGFLSWGLAWTFDTWVEDSPFPRWLSGVQAHEDANARRHDPFVTISAMVDAGFVQRMPPTLLIAGRTDPLGLYHSSVLAKAKLDGVPGVQVCLVEYEAGHAFIGLNPFILLVLQGNKWRTELAKPATQLCVEFLQQPHAHEQRSSLKSL